MTRFGMRAALGIGGAALLALVALPANASAGKVNGSPVVGKTLTTGSVLPVRGVPTLHVPPPPSSVVMRTAGPTVTSSNWSGYANLQNTYNGVSSTWRVPVTTCRSTSWDVFWVGLDGWGSPTVEQDGTGAYCSRAGAAPVYFSWWEMYPTNSVQPVALVRAGDVVTSTVLYANGVYTLRVNNLTQRNGFVRAQRCGANLACKNVSAEWVAEAPSTAAGRLNLAPFTPVTFVNDVARVGSTVRSIKGWPFSAIIMKKTNVDAVPTGLSANGQAFTVYWRNET